MGLTRQSFGIALTRYEVADKTNPLYEIPEFWHDYATAVLWLNVARDRIGLYLENAGFEVKPINKKNRGRDSDRVSYSIGFPGNRSLVGIANTVGSVNSVLDRLEDLREQRNSIIHEVASRRAETSLLPLKRKHSRESDRVPPSNRTVEARMAEAVATDENEYHKAIAKLREWYLDLVKVGALVFECEYWSRKSSIAGSPASS
jgi:hypothetical protein